MSAFTMLTARFCSTRSLHLLARVSLQNGPSHSNEFVLAATSLAATSAVGSNSPRRDGATESSVKNSMRGLCACPLRSLSERYGIEARTDQNRTLNRRQ